MILRSSSIIIVYNPGTEDMIVCIPETKDTIFHQITDYNPETEALIIYITETEDIMIMVD